MQKHSAYSDFLYPVQAVDPSKLDVGKFPTVEAPPMLTAGGGAAVRYSMQHRRQNSTPVVRQRFWGFKSLRPTPPLGAAQIMQIREVWLLCSVAYCS